MESVKAIPANVRQVLGTNVNKDFGEFHAWVRYIDVDGKAKSAIFHSPEQLDQFLVSARRRRQERDRSFVRHTINKVNPIDPTSPSSHESEARSWLGKILGRKSPYSSVPPRPQVDVQ